jgi:hypothetical protein
MDIDSVRTPIDTVRTLTLRNPDPHPQTRFFHSLNKPVMNKRESARLEMYERLAAYFSENAAAVDTVPAFRAAVDRFNGHLTALKAVYDEEVAGSQGATRTKREQREALCDNLASLCATVSAYADETDNSTLQTAMDVQSYELRELRSTELVQQARHLMAIIAPHTAALAPYAILPADITAMETAINDFELLKEEPRTVISERKDAGTATDTLFEAVDREVEARLDKMIGRYEITSPSFVVGYNTRRIIVDPATQPTRLRLEVSALRGGPIDGATATVNGTDLTGTTDNQGICLITGIRPGTWSVSFAHSAYKTGTLGDIVTKLGRTTRVKAELEAS